MEIPAQPHQRRYTLLLVTCPDIRWEGLRSLLGREPLVQVVAEVSPDEVTRTVARLHPDGFLFAADRDAEATLSSIRMVRDQQIGTRVLAFGDRTDYDLEIALARAGVDSILLWDNVNAVSLCWALGAVFEAGLRVVSPQAMDEIAFHERRAHPREEGLAFSDRERVVLAGLAEGLSERRIAEDQQLGPRTVERTVARLIEKLEARDLHELRRRAHDLGFGAES